MKRLSLLTAAACAAGLAGCASLSAGPYGNPFVLPAAAQLPLSESARVMAVKGQNIIYRTGFDGLFDEKGSQIRNSMYLPVAGSALVLSPGTYSISVVCKDATTKYVVPVRVKVQAGQTYSIACEYVQFSAPRASLTSESHAAWDARSSKARPG